MILWLCGCFSKLGVLWLAHTWKVGLGFVKEVGLGVGLRPFLEIRRPLKKGGFRAPLKLFGVDARQLQS